MGDDASFECIGRLRMAEGHVIEIGPATEQASRREPSRHGGTSLLGRNRPNVRRGRGSMLNI